MIIHGDSKNVSENNGIYILTIGDVSLARSMYSMFFNYTLTVIYVA